MGRTKKLRKKIATLEIRIAEHREKIAQELTKPRPNQGRIDKWRKEIASWQSQIERARKRLPRQFKKGRQPDENKEPSSI